MGSSNWWQTLSPLTSGENIVTKYYYENPVTKMKIEMNGKSHTFTMMHGKTLRDMVNSPENTYCADAKGWLNTKTNPWAMTRNGHEPYMCTKMCFNVNYKNHACQNKQKIGFALSQEAPCGHPGTGEGLGMIETCSNDNLASGRLQWSSETNYPHDAVVWVWKATTAAHSWKLAIQTKATDTQLRYSSNWWQTLSPLTSGENIVTKYYYENPVTKMKIEMNGKSHTFTMMHGKTLRDMVNSPKNTYCADPKGWKNTKTNPWAMTRTGHESY